MSDGRANEAPGDSGGHELLREQLPAYAMRCLQGRPDPEEWRALTRHLASCGACREELEELLLLLSETASGAGALDEPTPSFDLKQLPPFAERPAPPQQPEPPDTGPDWLRFDLGALLLSLVGQPQLAGAMRQAGEAGAIYRHELSVAPHGLDIALELAASERQRGLYDLTVTVVQASDPFGQAQHRLALRYGERQVEAFTDSVGSATFRALPHESLAQLQLALLPDTAG